MLLNEAISSCSDLIMLFTVMQEVKKLRYSCKNKSRNTGHLIVQITHIIAIIKHCMLVKVLSAGLLRRT